LTHATSTSTAYWNTLRHPLTHPSEISWLSFIIWRCPLTIGPPPSHHHLLRERLFLFKRLIKVKPPPPHSPLTLIELAMGQLKINKGQKGPWVAWSIYWLHEFYSSVWTIKQKKISMLSACYYEFFSKINFFDKFF
jgi:hypothetical protein